MKGCLPCTDLLQGRKGFLITAYRMPTPVSALELVRICYLTVFSAIGHDQLNQRILGRV